MNKQLFHLCNIPKASAFRLNGIPAQAFLRRGELEVRCKATVHWDVTRELRAVLLDEGDTLVPLLKHCGPVPGSLALEFKDPLLFNWQMSFPDLFVARINSSHCRNKLPQCSVEFYQPLKDVLLKSPSPQTVVNYRYWLPNFIFNGTTQLGRYRKKSIGDSFVVQHNKKELKFRQVADHKKIADRLKNREIHSAITSVIEIQNVMGKEHEKMEKEIPLICQLIEAFYGLKIRPLARAGYDKQGKMQELLFYRMGVSSFGQGEPKLMGNKIDKLLWENFLEGILPGFLAGADKHQLPVACWQMVEARRLCVPSCMAVLFMSLESMATAYLQEIGANIGWTTPIDHKLNLCNKELHCFPKRLTKELEDIRKKLRNPLFHQGRTEKSSTSENWKLNHDLFDACAALMASICNYRGKIGYTCADWRGITVDEYAAGVTQNI